MSTFYGARKSDTSNSSKRHFPSHNQMHYTKILAFVRKFFWPNFCNGSVGSAACVSSRPAQPASRSRFTPLCCAFGDAASSRVNQGGLCPRGSVAPRRTSNRRFTGDCIHSSLLRRGATEPPDSPHQSPLHVLPVPHGQPSAHRARYVRSARGSPEPSIGGTPPTWLCDHQLYTPLVAYAYKFSAVYEIRRSHVGPPISSRATPRLTPSANCNLARL